MREAVGDAAAVTAKVSLGDGFPGGVITAEGIEVTRLLEADGHLDALQLSGGSSLKTPMGRNFRKEYPFEEAYFWDKAVAFREALTIPLMLLGGINERATMDRAMGAGFDFVAVGRAVLREPDLVNRLASGGATEGICIHCNRCMPTIYSDRGTHCPVLP